MRICKTNCSFFIMSRLLSICVVTSLLWQHIQCSRLSLAIPHSTWNKDDHKNEDDREKINPKNEENTKNEADPKMKTTPKKTPPIMKMTQKIKTTKQAQNLCIDASVDRFWKELNFLKVLQYLEVFWNVLKIKEN